MEKVIDINNVEFIPDCIRLSTEANSYTTSEQIKIYIGDRIQLKDDENNQSKSKVSFAKELLKTATITVFRADNDDGNNIRYHAITENYYYHFIMSNINDKGKIVNNITILDIISGKSQISASNIANRSKKIKFKSNTYGFGVILDNTLYVSQKYKNPNNSEWKMSDSLFNGIEEKLIDFFDQDINRAEDIPESFKENIIDTIYQVNETERKIEEDKAASGASLKYSNFKEEKDVSLFDKKDKDATYIVFTLNVSNDTYKSIYESTYSEGTNIEINLKNNIKITGRIESVADTGEYAELVICFFQQFSLNDLNRSGEIKLKPNLTQYRVRKDIVNKLRNRNVESSYMYDTFSNFSTLDLRKETDEISEFVKSKETFEFTPPESQERAVKVGLLSDDIELVLGPPGTGKTTVIVAWIKFLIKHGKRILVSSKNNAAVDNVLERLPSDYIDEKGEKQELGIIRIGSNENKVSESCRKFLAKNRLADCRKHIDESTDETLELLNTLKKSIPSFIDKINTNIKYQNDITENASKIETLKKDPNYVKMIEHKDVLEVTYKNKKEERDKSFNYYSKYQKYVDEYKKLGIIGWLKEGILGLLIVLKCKNLKKGYLKLSKILEGYEKSAKDIDDSIKEFDKRFKPYQDKIDSIIKDNMIDVSDEIESYSLINPKIKNYFNFKHISDSDFDSIINIVNEMNLDKIIGIIDDWKQEVNTTGNRMLTDILAEESKVVGATCIGINSNKQFSNLKFDVTILDEAGQILIQDAIVPLTRSPKNILLGDHNQIPPQADEKIVEQCSPIVSEVSLLNNSFFEYLYINMKKNCPNNVVDLDSQFRMPADLADLVGWKFYDNKYKSPLKSKDSERGVVIPGTSKPLIVIDTSKAKNRFENQINEGGHKTYSNSYEAKVISNVVKRVFSNPDCLKKDEKAIAPYELMGIIAPYSKQIQVIRDAIRKEKLTCGNTKISDYVNDMVATLDSFQGQERPLIIFDFTRSSNTPSDVSRVGFLRELRRLNVAFTRSKKQLVIVGDMDYLTTCKFVDKKSNVKYKSEKEFSEFILNVVESAKNNGHMYTAEEFINA